jgi:hypothetical protein
MQVKIPDNIKSMLETGNLQGNIKITCGNNNGKCKGYIKIKGKTNK